MNELQAFKARFFRALAHPVRIRILEILVGGGRTVQELQAALALDQPIVSQQLAVLRNQEIVVAEKKGLSVRYTVRDPRIYLFTVNNPDALVRSAAESVLREIVAALTFEELLTSGRARVQREAVSRLTSRCHPEGPEDLGLRLEGLSIHDRHPPQEVVKAYHAVTEAMSCGSTRPGTWTR